MTDARAVRDPQQCREKQTLIDQIRGAIGLVLAIHNEELEAAMGGYYQSGESYASRLREARESRILLIEKLGRHVNEHGC